MGGTSSSSSICVRDFRNSERVLVKGSSCGFELVGREASILGCVGEGMGDGKRVVSMLLISSLRSSSLGLACLVHDWVDCDFWGEVSGVVSSSDVCCNIVNGYDYFCCWLVSNLPESIIVMG